MAYYDSIAADREILKKEQFEQLMKFIDDKEEFEFARVYILEMMFQIKSLESVNKKYLEFFEQLGKFIPQQSNINTPLI